MTADKDFKQVVRRRARKTGESYSTARRNVSSKPNPARGTVPDTSTRQKVTVVVAHDSALFRRGLLVALATEGIDVVAEVPSPSELVAACQQDGPDVVVTSRTLAGQSVKDALITLAGMGDAPKVILMDAPWAIDNLQPAWRSLDDVTVEDLVDAIRDAATSTT
jgi:DNA-binding NarL/FixJ family response regulator